MPQVLCAPEIPASKITPSFSDLKHIFLNEKIKIKSVDVSAKIRQMNPWWEDSAAVDADEHIARWLPMSYTPDALADSGWEDGGTACVLRGMRQVGKTTLMKTMIRKLLKGGTHPMRILYCDSADPESVREAVDRHHNLMNGSAVAGHRYLFLDGAASAPKWADGVADALKAARDASIVISGYVKEMGDAEEVNSRVPDFRRIRTRPNDAPTVPERLGIKSGGDATLTPMSFFKAAVRISPEIGEFAEGNGMFSPQGRRDVFDRLVRHEIDGRLEELCGYKRQLDRALDVYLATGGMPHAIDGYMRRGLSWDPEYQRHLDAMTQTWAALGRKPHLCAEFGRWLAAYEKNLVSLDKIAKGTGIMPPQMALNYANLLERLFLLHILYRYKNGRPDTSAAKKIIFADPSYLHAFRYSADPRALPAPLYVPDHRDGILEGVVATHLLRLARRMRPERAFEPRRSVFYWTDKKSRLVDFVLDLGENEMVPIKVKTGHVSRRDMSALTRFLKYTRCNGLLLGLGDLDAQRDYLTVPVSAFLMLA